MVYCVCVCVCVYRSIYLVAYGLHCLVHSHTIAFVFLFLGAQHLSQSLIGVEF